jgi:hypothetical protein
VEVIEACDEWIIRVVEDDQELTRSFEMEAFEMETFALTYAERVHG